MPYILRPHNRRELYGNIHNDRDTLPHLLSAAKLIVAEVIKQIAGFSAWLADTASFNYLIHISVNTARLFECFR